MDKKKTNKKKLSTLIKQQVPEFVLTDHPKFTEFLTSYFLFMESAELNLDTITDIDQILLETVGVADSFVLLNQTNKNGLDAGNRIVDEENTSINNRFIFQKKYSSVDGVQDYKYFDNSTNIIKINLNVARDNVIFFSC